MSYGLETDRVVAREVKRQIRHGASGCDDCDNTGWRERRVNPWMNDWELCPCWIGQLWEQEYRKLDPIDRA